MPALPLRGYSTFNATARKATARPTTSARSSAARDAVNAAGGGVLFFPRGTFVVSDTIELGASTTVLGLGAGSVLQAKPGVACFNMLLMRDTDNVRVRDLVLDGNRDMTSPPADPDNENIGCGFLGRPVDKGQTGLSIQNAIVRDHHRAGIRISGPHNSDDPYRLCPNEVEVIGCQIRGCGSRGVIVTRATRARIAGNVITSCTQAGIQLVLSRAAVIDGNVIQMTIQRKGTNAGHGIGAANSLDYVIVNNVASENERWGIAASTGLGLWPKQYRMSQRYVVANNICRANAAGGITIDPTLPKDHPDQIRSRTPLPRLPPTSASPTRAPAFTPPTRGISPCAATFATATTTPASASSRRATRSSRTTG